MQALHDGFRQREGSSVYTRLNQFIHSLQWNSLLRHLNLSFPETRTVQRNCLQRLVLIGSLRKEKPTVHTTFHMESSPEAVETIKSISLCLRFITWNSRWNDSKSHIEESVNFSQSGWHPLEKTAWRERSTQRGGEVFYIAFLYPPPTVLYMCICVSVKHCVWIFPL